MKVVVLGYGLIGKERIRALVDLRAAGCPLETVGVFDPHVASAATAAPDVVCLQSFEAVAELKPDWVIVAVPHDAAVELISRILPWGCRVLMEKPFGRSVSEARLLASHIRFPEQLWIGFNYRFFPGVAQAIADARSGRFGKLVSVSIVLGHGGSPGMEKGWKFDPLRAGGGCLIDPGIHLLDLCRLLSPGGVAPLQGWIWRGFWNTGIEEEAHLLLQADGFLINLQVSIVRWRSTFRFELHGTAGYGLVQGRGRSYGPQTYTRGRRWGWQGGLTQADSEERVLTSECDASFSDELRALLRPEAARGPLSPCRWDEALEVMRLYEGCLKGAAMNPTATGTDDWNTHWDHYASAASENPAQNFRHRLIIRFLCRRDAGSGMRVLDIGSGQGDLIKKLSERLSGGRFLGIDLSESGVAISRRKVPSAEFLSADLLEPPEVLARYHGWATHAACSEVLEHLDDPIGFLRQARKFLHADARVVITVPGGRMSAFDRHIGHRRHFNRRELRALLEQSGFSVERICLAGFPFFNLYRLVVIARGKRLVDDVKESNTGWSKRLSIVAMRVFDRLLHLNLPDSPFGWQLVAVAKNREAAAQ